MYKHCMFLAATLAFGCGSTLADTYQYQSDYFSGHSSGIFQPLTLNANSLKFTVSDGMPGQYNLDSVTIGFDQRESLTVRNFRPLPGNDGFIAKAYNAWVFKELDVVFRTSSYNTTEFGPDATVEIFIPNISSVIDPHIPYDPGMLLFNGQGFVFDVSPKQLADRESYVIDSKTVTLKLMNRLGQFQPPSMPVPGFEHGFELNVDWLGHGQRKVFINAPIDTKQFAQYRAVALKVLEMPMPEGMDYMISVEFEETFSGHRMESSAYQLRHILNSAFPAPL